jgi:WD40 repeat protein
MRLLKGHHTGFIVPALAFSPDGATLAAACTDNALRLWDLHGDGCRLLRPAERWPRCLAFAPDGADLAFACERRWVNGGGVRVWRIAEDQLRRQQVRLRRCGKAAERIAEDQRQRQGDDEDSCSYFFLQLRHLFPNRNVHQFCFSADGRLLGATCDDGVLLWDRDLDAAIPVEVKGIASPESLAFAPNGRLLAVGCRSVEGADDRPWGVRLVNLDRERDQGLVRGLTRPAKALAFSPDGAVLAAACAQALWLWDATVVRPVARISPDHREFRALAFTPDGRHLVTARTDHTVRVWETRTWKEVAAYNWGIGPLVSLAVAADGMRAAVGSKWGLAVVWDVDL